MDSRTVLTCIARLHNTLSEISVRGDDVMRMAGALQACRNLAEDLQAELNSGADADGKR